MITPRFKTKQFVGLVCTLLTTFGCGLKVTSEVYDNLLFANWDLTKIECYQTATRSNLLEEYPIDANTEATLNFKSNSEFTYEVHGSCTTNAYGRYSSDFDGDDNDTVTLFKVVTGNTCEIDITDNGASKVGVTSVDFTLLESLSSDLYWKVTDGTTLNIKLPTNFTGSNESTVCAEKCFCYGVFTQN